ncbi:MAG: glycosyltransferase family 2 protein, partial [Candidatus Zixiibacteriota bacterium]
MFIIEYIVYFTIAYISAYVFYNYLLLTAHYLIKDNAPHSGIPKTRFIILIPAHNEELLLARVLESFKVLNYPPNQYEVVVIADNCTDNTAGISREHGVDVIERYDEENKGKGRAIKYALENIDMENYDAAFIIDADSVADSELLTHLDQILTEGGKIIQCNNGVGNADKTWFTRLLDVSRNIENEILQPGKHKLGLSSHLTGNGMCFSTGTLKKYGWGAFSVGEDWEYYAKLIMKGEMVKFANRAKVFHEESSSLKQATSQRIRWSSGRFAIVWKYGLAIFYRGVIEGNIKKVDASLPLIFPNPSLAINLTLLLLFIVSLLPIANRGAILMWCTSLIVLQLSL